VSPLDQSGSPYVTRLAVRDHAKAVAIASVLRPLHEFGNVRVAVEVTDGTGAAVRPSAPASAAELADLVRTAFHGNPWYRDVAVRGGLGGQSVYPVLARSVVQFFDDDLSDLHGNYNAVAASVFAELLERAPGGQHLHCSTDTA
jgi:hypothetical protein